MSTSSSGNESTKTHTLENSQNKFKQSSIKLQEEQSDDELFMSKQDLDHLIESTVKQEPIKLDASPDIKLKEKIPTNPSLSVSDDETLINLSNIINDNVNSDYSKTGSEAGSFF